MAVGVSHQFIGFFGGCIEAHRVIDSLRLLKWKVGITAIDGTAGSINKMFNFMMSASFQNMAKAYKVALDISAWVFE